MKKLRTILLLLFFSLNAENLFSFVASKSAKFSLITCTPGPDLYSLFGHSAIRYQDSIRGEWVDWVYNYGTFIFDDDFYVKFARGKLDYLLTKEDFSNFQTEYIMTGRGIFEQEFLLDDSSKQTLLDLLEENALPENRIYRYDFFYDNCATRVRDMIMRATSGSDKASSIGYTHPDPNAIKEMSRINFSYVYPGNCSYRQAIQRYLNYQPWSDFGIDIALGLPCDREIEKGQYMFLPDSMLKDFNYAVLNDSPLTTPAEELLPQDFELEVDNSITPMQVMFAFLILHLLVGILWMKRNTFQISDRVLFFITGLLGVFVIFLWFFTDHTATKWNLNLLWANPINLIFAFASSKKWLGWRLRWMKIYFAILLLMLIFWFVLPQEMNLAVIPIIFALLFTTWKISKPTFLLGRKSANV
jgi:hypothetical protein